MAEGVTKGDVQKALIERQTSYQGILNAIALKELELDALRTQKAMHEGAMQSLEALISPNGKKK